MIAASRNASVIAACRNAYHRGQAANVFPCYEDSWFQHLSKLPSSGVQLSQNHYNEPASSWKKGNITWVFTILHKSHNISEHITQMQPCNSPWAEWFTMRRSCYPATVAECCRSVEGREQTKQQAERMGTQRDEKRVRLPLVFISLTEMQPCVIQMQHVRTRSWSCYTITCT